MVGFLFLESILFKHMKFQIVPVALIISVTSLFVFILGATGVNYVDSKYTEAQNEVDSLLISDAKNQERIDSLARALYSETRKSREMYYVGWVIRNRVELRYNGKSTYKDVILDPYQFSAFNPGRKTRYEYINLDVHDLRDPVKQEKWFNALEMAIDVVDGDARDRPFPRNTLYFYSEISMPGGRKPQWEDGVIKVSTPGVDKVRFRFFADFTYERGTPESIPPSTSQKTAVVR